MKVVDRLARAWDDAEANSALIDRLHVELLRSGGGDQATIAVRLAVRLSYEVFETNDDLARDLRDLAATLQSPASRLVLRYAAPAPGAAPSNGAAEN